jgi:hypothetical protein
MAVQAISIQGWKWADIDTATTAQNNATEFFGLPIDPDAFKTTRAFDIQEAFNSVGDIIFYYTPYTFPSQMKEALGDPQTFDINIEIPDEE